jgi:hypothetical protein
MRSLHLAALFLLLPVGPVLAQAQPSAAQQPSDIQLRNQFRNNFLRGCNSGRTQGVSDQRGYCTCMADAYNSRYDGRTLAVISTLAGQAGQAGPQLADAMMSPERRICTARF